MGAGSTRSASARLRAEPEAVAEARALLERMLVEANVERDRRFEALLVTSELVTNAVVHGSSPGDEVTLDVSLDGALLRIAVGDTARGSSSPAALSQDAGRPAGRGLALVGWLADWSERLVAGRREVCAELTIPPGG